MKLFHQEVTINFYNIQELHSTSYQTVPILNCNLEIPISRQSPFFVLNYHFVSLLSLALFCFVRLPFLLRDECIVIFSFIVNCQHQSAGANFIIKFSVVIVCLNEISRFVIYLAGNELLRTSYIEFASPFASATSRYLKGIFLLLHSFVKLSLLYFMNTHYCFSITHRSLIQGTS